MNQIKAMKLGRVSLFLWALLPLLIGSVAFAQVSASMTGRVEDPSEAPIPSVDVTVTSLETGAARTVTTDETGSYRVLSLPVGRYEVRAQKPGFKAEVQTGINLVVGQQAVVNLRLAVGAVQEQVTVTSDAPLVNTTTESVAGLVGESQVKDLPINGRSFDLLITLNAGAINYTAIGKSGTGAHFFSVAGRRPSENVTLVNGVEYVGAGTNDQAPGGASGQMLGIDAVREYNVVPDTYGAEYGKRGGAQVSVVTQSGTNQLHGSLFEFIRNSDLDARNFFDQTTIPPFQRNQFGGALGGPIRKDKTFIFGNYEGFRQRLANSGITFVPDLNTRQGLLPCGTNGPACAGSTAVGTPTIVPGLNNNMLPFMTLWPVPNGPVLGGGIAEALTSPVQTIREDFGTIRLDQRFSDKDSFAAVYTISDGYTVSPSAALTTVGNSQVRNQLASMQETHIFSPHVINTVTAGFTRTYNKSLTNPVGAPLPPNLAFVQGSPVEGAIAIGSESLASGVTTLTGVGTMSVGSFFARNLFTYSDGLQVIKGKHQISAGVWFQRIENNDWDPNRGNAQATFTNLQTLLQGTVATFGIATGNVPLGWRSWEGAWYLQDAIQLRQNLTLRLGLRQEFSNGWTEVFGRAQAILFDPSGVIQTLPKVGSSPLTDNNSKWLFGPRIGLAWDPFGNGKTSIRTAFGIYYDLVDSLNYQVDVTPPLNGSASFSNINLFSLIPVNPLAPVLPPCAPGIPTNQCNIYSPKGVQSNFKVPMIESWNFAVEQQLTKDMALRVAYVGSEGHHEFVNTDPNSIPVQTCQNAAGCLAGGVNVSSKVPASTVPQGAQYIPVGARPNPYETYGIFLMSEGNQNYNALQVEVTKRLTQGLQFRGNYTWAKNMDNQSGINPSVANNENGTVLNLNNLRQDWGPAALTPKHQASANVSYELPFGQGKALLSGVHGVADKLVGGWQLNSIVTLLSGFPFTPLIGANYSGNGNLNTPDRPSFNPAFTGPIVVGLPTEWYNPKAFVLPTPGTNGNVGRGVFRGPGMEEVDFSVFKNIPISERFRMQFRGEFFNILNRANFGPPTQAVFSGSAISATAGVVTRTATTSRQVQFSLKLTF